MQRNKELVSEEQDEFGILPSGRRYKRQKIGLRKDNCTVSLREEKTAQSSRS
jgi:hypothetical protein